MDTFFEGVIIGLAILVALWVVAGLVMLSFITARLRFDDDKEDDLTRLARELRDDYDENKDLSQQNLR